MGFEYSSFFSYRRNHGDASFINNLRSIIQTEGHTATNFSNVFFDEESILLGNEFDSKIYTSIIKSCSFTLFFSPHYINEKNDWCARELYRAIQFEKYIRNKINNNDFSFIFPLIYRGTPADLPKGINKKNAKTLREYSSDIANSSISSYPVTQRFQDFKEMIHDVFLINFKLIEDIPFTWEEIEQEILIPTDEEFKNWINEQKGILRENESKNLPKLT